MNIEASFVRSVASASDLPQDGLAEIALVGRSNVGKSSLINALARRSVARTSAAPGKTRLANLYRIARGGAPPLHLVDLPGYGYARGRARRAEGGTGRRAEDGKGLRAEGRGLKPQGEGLRAEGTEPDFDELAQLVFARKPAALLLVDARHPGLESDRAAWAWLSGAAADAAVVATKIDKLSRGERIRAMSQLQSVFDEAVVAVSAATGEGLEALWNLIDRLANSRSRTISSSSRRRNQTAPLPPRK